MNILALETSCDETAFALIQGQKEQFKIKQHFVASQIKTHAQYGGVVPEVAAREHVETLFPLLQKLDIQRDGTGIDVIAVTAGPGLIPALRIGVACATTLAHTWKKPLVAVNHLEGHLYSCWVTDPKPLFPALALLVSGGHTELIWMKNHGEYKLIGTTRDDAAGEAFDKVAKQLGYPGGPIVSTFALNGKKDAISFPRPMLESGDSDFSFSGLKTAVFYYLKEHPQTNVADVCASFQEAVIDTLVTKTLQVIKTKKPKSVLLAGGVSANQALRDCLGKNLAIKYPDVTYHVPPLEYTTDNAVMIAIAGYYRAQKSDFANPLTLKANPNLRLLS